MARIRSIKPEFWTAEQVMELSRDARLMFIGLWNFCDDAGIHPASSKTLKAEVFPADDITSADVRRMIDECIQQELVIEYDVGGRSYWQITGWHHQKIEKPNFKHPGPDGKKKQNGVRYPSESILRDNSRDRNAAKSRVLDRDGNKCAYCGTADSPLQLDHVVAVSLGGTDDDENLALACEHCNKAKGSKPVADFIRSIRRPIADLSPTIRRLVADHSPPESSRVESRGEEVNNLSVVAGSGEPKPVSSKIDSPTRKGAVCGLLRKAGMADAAPHYLTDEVWDSILAKRTDEEIVEVAKAKMALRPGQRTGLKYIAQALLDDPAHMTPSARASPPARNTREARISNYAAEAAQARGEHENEHGTGRTERDITGESIRVA